MTAGARQGVGRVIDNKYEILANIGHGGMSEVWLCRDRRLNKTWAIKEIKPNVAGAQGRANRRAILDEADFMKRLDHPAIPRVVDIIDEGATIFVVMDYVEGRSLNKVLKERDYEPFGQDEVIDWGIQLCDVLGYLHARLPPVVYRDLKPANVMLRDDGSVKLIDFGISVELVEGQGDDGRIVGSPGYSAPEQIEREMHARHPVDVRADVYALGATLYTLITGQVPRLAAGADGGRRYEFVMRPIREANPKLSDGLEQIILRATRRDPEERYQTVVEMRYDLEHYEELTQEHRAVQQRKVGVFRRRLVGAGVAALVGVACVAASLVVRSRSYGALVHEASVASTEEVNVRAANAQEGTAREAGASEAETLYAQAIEVEPARIDTYEDLLGVYKADDVFTPTEAQRWTRVWQRYGAGLAGDAAYARLCYDAGMLYLCYYDYMGTKDQTAEARLTSATGQGAIENATRSADWFARARAACDPEAGDYRGLEQDEYAATEVFGQIAEFYRTFSQSSLEGRDMTEEYAEFWDSLVAVVGTNDRPGVVEQSEPIVRLRLYQVAFEAVSSPTYLTGFMRAGVTQREAEGLLNTIEGRVAVGEIASLAESNPAAAEAMYGEIVDGADGAYDNVSRTYNSPVARMSGVAGGDVKGTADADDDGKEGDQE